MNLSLPAFDILELSRRLWTMLAGIVTSVSTSFKVELMQAIHDFTNATGDTFKMSLFKAQAAIAGTYDATTMLYQANADEVANGSGYLTGGVALVNTTPQSTGTVAYTTPNGNAQWAAATFVTSGCQVYNSTKGNRSWFVYNFGQDLSVVAGTLTVTMPVNDDTHALLRLN